MVPSATTVAMEDAPVRSLMMETEILGKMVWRGARAVGAARVEVAKRGRIVTGVFILKVGQWGAVDIRIIDYWLER